jgi:hypothetical protein
MGAYQKLKWKRTLNEYKFIKEEYDLVKTLARESAADFQEHYESFMLEKGYDLNKINQDNQDKIDDAYNVEQSGAVEQEPILEQSAELMKVENFVEKTEEVQMSEDDIVIHNVFTKLFKAIATKVHPDKIDPAKYDFEQRRKMENSFKEANKALRERDYFILIDIAEKLDIPLPKNYDQQTRWMKNQLQEIAVKLRREKTTYNYLFTEKETKEERDNLIRQFVNQLFGIDIN